MNQDSNPHPAEDDLQVASSDDEADRLCIRRPYLRLVSTGGVEWDGKLAIFIDDDPQIFMETRPCHSPLARLEVDHDPDVLLAGPILYVDYGQGFSQTTALPLRQDARGKLSCTLACPDRLSKLRFDPDAAPGAVHFQRIELVASSSPAAEGVGRAALEAGAESDDGGRPIPLDRVPIPLIHQLNAELNAPGARQAELVVLEQLYPELMAAVTDYISRDDDAKLSDILRSLRLKNWYVSSSSVETGVEYLARNGEFDYAYYELQLQGGPDAAMFQGAPKGARQRRLLKHYLLRGVQRGLRPARGFDPGFYLGMYADDLQGAFVDPFVHWLRQGRHERRYPRKELFDAAVRDIAPLMEADFYKLEAGLKATADAAEHYVRYGSRHDIRPRPDFSPQYYLKRYPDLDPSITDPLVHYGRYGKLEGRLGVVDLGVLRDGRARYDPNKPTVLIANHEGSRTGAPIVGLALAEHLSRSFNVITHLGRGGPLESRFYRVSIAVAVAQFDSLDAEYFLQELVRSYNLSGVVTNSVESAEICLASLHVDVPCLALVHEFAEYTRPDGKIANVVAAADRVVLPSKLVSRSIDRECVRHFNFPPNHVLIRPQGYIEPELRVGADDLRREDILEIAASPDGSKRRIVLGGGYVQIRKGVDLFLETAAEFVRRGRQDVCFIWVGEGYDPQSDMTFSLWLREMVERMGLAETVKFLPAQKSFKLMLELCDVFYLPSRLDPFPNVVVDALFADKPVVCFQEGTGADELFLSGWAEGDAVPYCDVIAAARAIEGWLDRPVGQRIQDAGRLSSFFSFASYAEDIEAALGEAQASRRELIGARDQLLGSGAFDPAFYEGDLKAWAWERRAVTDYVAKAWRGFAKFNPCPGFSDGVYRSTHAELGSRLVPLLAALDPSQPSPATHRCVKLEGPGLLSAPSMRAAVHVHLHYTDTAPSIRRSLERLRYPVDLFITTSGRARAVQVEAAFQDFEWGEVEIIDVPNRGRDIGPFITAVLPRVSGGAYDIVGHFHSKKTLAAGSKMGVAWRNYLLDTLLGEPDEFLALTARFERDPALGLLFAEDRHVVGWSDNRLAAQDLMERLGLGRELVDFPVFPLGTMFWGRPEALAPLSGRLDWRDYPPEPVKPDGTVLHALERLLPTICRRQGYGWETVYRPGAAW